MATPNVIAKGIPIVFQDIIDNVTTYYPEYLDLVSPTQTEDPLVLRPFDAVPPPPGTPPPTFSYKEAILIAMVSPPNTSARPASIDGLDIDASFVANFQGISPEFAQNQPMIAPDVFEEFESGHYADQGDAITDVTSQVDVYRAANPDVLVLGVLYSAYNDGAMDNLATARLAGKQLV